MSPISKIAFGIGSILLAVQVTHAAPPKAGTVYVKAGGSSTNSSLYTTIVTMNLPAGNYHVSGRGTVNNQTGATDTVSCNVYAAASSFVDANTTTVASASYGALAFEGTAVIPSGGSSVWVECISGNETGPFTSAQLVASLVPAIVTVP